MNDGKPATAAPTAAFVLLSADAALADRLAGIVGAAASFVAASDLAALDRVLEAGAGCVLALDFAHPAADALAARWKVDPFYAPCRVLALVANFGALAQLPFAPHDATTRTADAAELAFRIGQLLERLRRERHAPSEDALATAQAAARVGTWELDPVTGRALWSPGIWRLLGFEPDSIEPSLQAWMQAMHRDDRDATAARFGAALAGTAETFEDEFRIVQRGGAVRCVLSRACFERDAAGAVRRITGVNFDITEREQAEQRLRRENEFHEVLTELASDFQFDLRVRSDGKLAAEWVSDGFERMLGVTPNGLGARGGWLSIVAPEDRSFAHDELERLLAGRSVRGTIRFVTRDAAVLWAQYQVRPVVEAGRVVRLYGATRDVTAQCLAEQELRESEARLQLCLEGARMFAWDWDLSSGRITHSAGAREVIGWLDAAAAIEDPAALPSVHPDDRARVRATVEQAIARCSAYVVEFRARRPDGEFRWMEAHGRVLCAPDGRPLRITGITVDIARRKEAERALAASEQRHRLAIEAADLGTWDYDAQARTLTFSDLAKRWFGLAPGDAIDVPSFFAIVHEADRPRVLSLFERVTRGSERAFDLEYRAIGVRDGIERWVAARGALVDDDSGTRRFVGTLLDVSSRRRFEAALRESESRFRVMAEAMPGVVFTARPDGHVEYLNSWFWTYTGRDRSIEGDRGRQPARASPWCEALHPDDAELLGRNGTEELLAARADARVRIRGRDGGYHWFLCRCSAIRDEHAVTVRWLGICTDIDELVGAEAALREADRRKDEFLATLAHELRNPLAPLRTSVQLLRLGASRVPTDRLLAIMDGQVDHLVRLVDDLMEVSRVSRGEIALKRERIDLRLAVESGIELSQPLMEAARHEFEWALPSHPVIVEGDPVRLAQVIANLLNNAAKYTEERGRVALALEDDGLAATIRVEDDGIGIPAESLGTVFDMFTQVDRLSRRVQGGLGIGLALVRALVEMHGGSVRAQSAGPGSGSAFTVTLPLAAPADAAVRAATASAENGDLADRRVLVVDDNVEAAESLAIALQLLDVHTRIAHDGPTAIAAAAEFDPHLVLLDLGLPGMDGHEVARRLRAEHPQPLTIVAVSGWGEPEMRARSLAAGCDEHLVKPVDLREIHRYVRESAHGRGRMRPGG